MGQRGGFNSNQNITANISKGIQDFKPPNLLIWGVIPASIMFLLIILIAFKLDVQFTGTTKQKLCTMEGKEKKCKDVDVSNSWKMLVLIMLLIILPLGIGFSFYKLGIMILNPKLGAGILATGMVVDTFN